MTCKFSFNFKSFFTASLHVLWTYILLLFIFFIFRTILLVFFNDSHELYRQTSDLVKAYFFGFRFDTMTIFYGLLVPMILNTIGIFTGPFGDIYFGVIKKFFRIYYTILVVLFIIVGIVDLYFYNFFMTHISIIVFGIIHDDTNAVVLSIWDDYPVVIFFISVIILSFLFYHLIGIIQKSKLKEIKSTTIVNFLIFLIMWFFYIWGIRGTFAYYPLRINDSIISQYIFINSLVPNGVYALKTAISDNNEQNVNTDIEKTMNSYGFKSPDEAVSMYVGRPVPNDPDSLLNALFSQTPENQFLKDNPPNVVFVLMESMSEHFISLHNKDSFNLLGALENVFPYCEHFTHFLPATGATIHSLEGLMVNSPMTPIAQSVYMNDTLNTSSAKPFKENGYHTVFLTGSKLGWRNLDKFVPNQYFDDVEGSAVIEKYVPNTFSNEWGCYDEFLFNRMYDKLRENKRKPQFIFALTTTNHTPYSLPDTYKSYPLEIPKNILSKISSKADHAKVHFLTYQYANDCLGKFIGKVKNSPLGENTIIVATGDHNARRIFDYDDTNMLQKYAVPLILYVPEKYKPDKTSINTNCFGSHKDIFPTIYHLSLSNTPYVKSGINLFNQQEASQNYAMAEYSILMNNKGCIYFKEKPIFYTWGDSTRTILKVSKEKNVPVPEQELVYGKSFIASMTYLVQRYLSEK